MTNPISKLINNIRKRDLVDFDLEFEDMEIQDKYLEALEPKHKKALKKPKKVTKKGK